MTGTITICDYLTAKNTAWKYDACISIMNPGRLLFEKIEGCDVIEQIYYDIPSRWPGYKYPEAHHVTECVDFARKYQDKTLLIHCTAGISRSTGMALAILIDRMKDVNLAYKTLMALRPQARPNNLILEYIPKVLDLDLNIRNIVFDHENGFRSAQSSADPKFGFLGQNSNIGKILKVLSKKGD